MATLKPDKSSVTKDPGRPDGVEPQEAARSEEGQRQKQDTSVPASLGGLPRRIGEDERGTTDGEEEHEVDPPVGPVGVELGAQQQ
jgi:hypothetical protein